MSMNLHCDEMVLRQTPTHITYMCMSINPATGEPDGGVDGVKRRYIHWLSGTLNGVWEDGQALQLANDSLAAHIREVRETEIKKFYIV